MGYFFASQPVAADHCPGSVITGRTCNLDPPARVVEDFGDSISGQGQVVVVSQRLEQVPSGLAAGVHLKFGAVAVAYRKAVRALGLAASGAIGFSTTPGWTGRGLAPRERHD